MNVENRILVGNLPFKTTAVQVEELFKKFGVVLAVEMGRDGKSSRPRGFAYVTMGSAVEALSAIRELDGAVFGGRKLVLTPAPANIVVPGTAGVGHSSMESSFTVWIDPGAADERDIKELFSALSELSRAVGANGLIFERDRSQHPIVFAESP